jgi:3-oxoadipate enol-lactonase
LEIERDGARLWYNVMGSGPDVVLLHPTPVNHTFWSPMAEHLAGRYRLTLVDLRGHGRSQTGAGTITMARLAEDIQAVLRASGIARAAFVGCSIGGYLIYECWRRFPAQIAAMALICGKPQPDSTESRAKRTDLMRSAQEPGGLEKFFDYMAAMPIGETAKQREPGVVAAARAMMENMQLETVLAVQQGLMERPDSVPTLQTMTAPVCAIAGGEDVTNLPDDMRAIPQHIPHAEFHLLEDAGHYAPFEQPQVVGKIVREFLDRVDFHPSSNIPAGSDH